MCSSTLKVSKDPYFQDTNNQRSEIMGLGEQEMSMPSSAYRKSTWRAEVRRGASDLSPPPHAFFRQPPTAGRLGSGHDQVGSPQPALRLTRCWRSPGAAPPPGQGLSSCQGRQGPPVVAKPVHGLLQPWDPEALGHLRSSTC